MSKYWLTYLFQQQSETRFKPSEILDQYDLYECSLRRVCNDAEICTIFDKIFQGHSICTVENNSVLQKTFYSGSFHVSHSC